MLAESYDEALVAAAEATEASKWAADFSSSALDSLNVALTLEKQAKQLVENERLATNGDDTPRNESGLSSSNSTNMSSLSAPSFGSTSTPSASNGDSSSSPVITS